MEWYPSLFLEFFHQLVFPCRHTCSSETRGTIPTSLLVFVEKCFYSPYTLEHKHYLRLTCTHHSWEHTSTGEGSGNWHRQHSWCHQGPSICWSGCTPHCKSYQQHLGMGMGMRMRFSTKHTINLPVHFHGTSNSLPSCSYTAAYGPDLASFTYHTQHVTAQTEQVVGTQVLAEWNVLQASTDLKLAGEPVGRISSVSVRYTELLPLVVWKSPT